MMMYWFTTKVEPMCDDDYLLRHLLRKIVLKPEYYIQFRGEGYNDMSEYIEVEIRLGSMCRPDLCSSIQCVIFSLYLWLGV